MANTTTDNRNQFATIELSRRNMLLEETLQQKEDLLHSLQGSEKRYRRLFEKPFTAETLAAKVHALLAYNSDTI